MDNHLPWDFTGLLELNYENYLFIFNTVASVLKVLSTLYFLQ